MLFKDLKCIIIIIFLTSVGVKGKCSINADSTKLKNSIYLELLGTGYYYSLNYERVILSKNKSSMTLRSGLNWHPFTPKAGGGSNLILGLNYNREVRTNLFFSIGINSVFWITYLPLPNIDEIGAAINDPNHWGQPYKPFMVYSQSVKIEFGKIFKLSKFISIAFTPQYLFKYNVYQENKLLLWGGIKIGKYF